VAVFGAAALGLVIGSFLNVAILRLPEGGSLLGPPSHCPRCGKKLSWYHNVPIVSWLALRGRCAYCGERISIQYPLVELAAAIIWGGNVAVFGLSLEAVVAICLMTLLLAIAVTDARFYVIPDLLSLGGVVLGIALAIVTEILRPDAPIGLREAVIGSIVGGGILWIVAIVGTWAFKKDAMGGGDIKMMAMIGAFLGWKGAILTIFLGALAGTIVFVPLTWKSDRLVPLGLFLALGAALTFYLGGPLLQWYLGLFV